MQTLSVKLNLIWCFLKEGFMLKRNPLNMLSQSHKMIMGLNWRLIASLIWLIAKGKWTLFIETAIRRISLRKNWLIDDKNQPKRKVFLVNLNTVYHISTRITWEIRTKAFCLNGCGRLKSRGEDEINKLKRIKWTASKSEVQWQKTEMILTDCRARQQGLNRVGCK